MIERIYLLRKTLSLSQENFGKRIGLTKHSISAYENGDRQPTERVISDICREFNVNEEWLRTGEGDMLIETDDSIFSELMTEYKLSPLEQTLVKTFLTLSPEERDNALVYVKKLIATVIENYNDYRDEIPLAPNGLDDAGLYDFLSAQGSKEAKAATDDEKKRKA